MNKTCPMNNNNTCSENCALYIAPQDLNEVVLNKLASLGLLSRNEGICSYKHMALCMSRNIFEKNSQQSRLGR